MLLFKLAANSLTDLFSTLELLNELAVLLVDNVGGKEAGPLTPLSVDSSRASPESGVLPAEVFGLEPSLNRLNSPVKFNKVKIQYTIYNIHPLNGSFCKLFSKKDSKVLD